jgi:hypothetical protein
MADLSITALVAAGYVPYARAVGRFVAGAGLALAPAAPGTVVVGRNSRRIALTVYNAGTAAAYWSNNASVDTTNPPLPSGAAKNWDSAPVNALYFAADAGADLRVDEVVLVHPDEVF